MADIVDPATRSRMMSSIRNANTKPEVAVRKGLFALGFRYRLNVKHLPGKPDLAFRKYRAVIFINGCFWHRHNCGLFRMPATNREFWYKKLERNRIRDEVVRKELSAMKWRILTIWECSFRGPSSRGFENVIDQAAKWLLSSKRNRQIRGKR